MTLSSVFSHSGQWLICFIQDMLPTSLSIETFEILDTKWYVNAKKVVEWVWQNKFGWGMGYQINFNYGYTSITGPRKTQPENTCSTGRCSIDTGFEYVSSTISNPGDIVIKCGKY